MTTNTDLQPNRDNDIKTALFLLAILVIGCSVWWWQYRPASVTTYKVTIQFVPEAK